MAAKHTSRYWPRPIQPQEKSGTGYDFPAA